MLNIGSSNETGTTTIRSSSSRTSTYLTPLRKLLEIITPSLVTSNFIEALYIKLNNNIENLRGLDHNITIYGLYSDLTSFI